MMEKNEELEFRIKMCEFCISVIEKSDDPRKVEALDFYRGQLFELKSKYVAINKPPDVVVHLKPAILTADIPK